MTLSLDERLESVRSKLAAYEQSHLLAFFEELDSTEQATLLEQIEGINFEQISKLVENYVKQKPETEIPEQIDAAPYYPLVPTADLEARYTEAKAYGEKLISEGKVAAFTVAGGQGTRLGWNGPKGSYPASIIEGKTLFQLFTEYLMKVNEKYDTIVPWYIMTSPINDAPTRAFFKNNNYFGYAEENIRFFPQGTMPSLSYDGKILLAGKGSVALNPDGHGGSLKALGDSGAIADMRKRGVEQISYFQIDNANVKCIDPLFVGLHAQDQAQMSSKMLEKTNAFEKLGNFCLINGRVAVIEYSDLPDELAEEKTDDGNLKFRCGSIAIHMLSVDFVEGLNSGDDFGLPFHRADKKVPHIDTATGELVEPSEPNAVKLETFVFDALPLCEKSIIYETDRVEEFAPVKNAEGVDSAASSKLLQSQRAARWLKALNIELPWKDAIDDSIMLAAGEAQVDADIEISPLTAIESADLAAIDLPSSIDAGQKIVL